MKRLLLFFVSLLIVVVVEAQSNFQIRNASTTGKGLVYNTEAAVILEGKTNGFAAGYMWGNLKTYYKTSFYKIELGYLRNPKESRISPQGLTVQTANSYIYGKRNSFWQLKGGWGAKRYLSEKDATRGVAVGLSYSFGPNLGLLKPYYLQLHSSENSILGFILTGVLMKIMCGQLKWVLQQIFSYRMFLLWLLIAKTDLTFSICTCKYRLAKENDV